MAASANESTLKTGASQLQRPFSIACYESSNPASCLKNRIYISSLTAENLEVKKPGNH